MFFCRSYKITKLIKILLQISLILLIFISQLFAKEIFWYVGAAFVKPAKEIAVQFENKFNNSEVIIISGGSQILLQKIILSKKGDIFLPGGKHYGILAKNKGLVIYSENFIEQVPVFALSEKGSKKIKTFSDIYKKNIKLALGNDKTMALGKIYLRIRKKMPAKIRNSIDNKCIIKGTDVSQIANYIKMGIVDTGTIFKSVAKVFHLKFIEIPGQYLITDNAPLIMLKLSKNKKLSKNFFNFIISKKGIFQKYGYKTCF